MVIDTPYIRNSLGLSNEDLLKIVAYLLDFNENAVLELRSVGVENVSSTPELYVSLIWYFFNKLYKEERLLKSYSDKECKELNYLVGEVDITKSVNSGSVGRGYYYQTVSKLSYDSPANNVLGFCLACFVNMDIGTKEYNNILKDFYKTIFNRYMPVFKRASIDDLLKYIEIAYDYTDGDYAYGFSDYRDVLKVCKLFMQSLYYFYTENHDENIGYSDSRMIEFVMENFTRSVTRRVMRNIARKYNLTNKYRIWNSDLVFQHNTLSPDLRLDILIKFLKGIELPDIILEVKTNKNLLNNNKRVYGHGDNVDQISSYTYDYSVDYKRSVFGILFHYVAKEYSYEADMFDGNKIKDKRNNLFFWVYVIRGSFDTKDVESFIYKRLVKLLNLEW